MIWCGGCWSFGCEWIVGAWSCASQWSASIAPSVRRVVVRVAVRAVAACAVLLVWRFGCADGWLVGEGVLVLCAHMVSVVQYRVADSVMFCEHGAEVLWSWVQQWY